MPLGSLFHPVPADFPNRLAEPAPFRPRLPRPTPLLVLLVLACLVPRILMATRLPSLCPDGLLYIRLGQKLQQGDIQGGLGPMRLNIYPAVLAALNRLGLPWQQTGKYWGLVVSSLVLLPLFGWIRRQFDDRVASWACLLYALHPELIAWSPETIRDPTFWLVFVLAIYLLWRAVVEVRVGLFLASGCAILLAVLTRFEGFFLLVPLGFWSFWRWLALRQARGRLLVGLALCLAVVPAGVALVNLTWLRPEDRWILPRFGPAERVVPWLRSLAGQAPAGADFAAALDRPAERLSTARMARVFIPTVVKGFTPVFGLLMLLGLWRWRRTWGRRDHQPLFWVSILILSGIWIGLWATNSSCTRYVLPIVVMGLGFGALGWLDFASHLRRLAGRWWDQSRLERPLAVGLAAGLLASSIPVVLAKDCRLRAGQLRLAEWLQQRFGPSPRLAGPNGFTPVVSHYAGGQCRGFAHAASWEPVSQMLQQFQPDVVLLVPTRSMGLARFNEFLAGIIALGWRRVDPAELPAGCEEIVVLVRAEGAMRLAARHRARRLPEGAGSPAGQTPGVPP
ncbi:MAG: glycosyltransferase family 39 protein [Thermoguttaceae bacterium]